MAFGSPALIPLLLLACLLVDPEVLCYWDYNQMRGFDDYNPEGGGGVSRTPGQQMCYLPDRPPQPCPPQDSPDHMPPWEGGGQLLPNPASPSPPSSSSSSPPPPPPHRNRTPPPKQNATRNERDASPSEEEKQGKHTKPYVAKLGWAFLGAGLALQFVLGAYLAYQRREMQRFGMWLEKIPSISPPPSPAGFAPYTAAR